MAMKHFRHGLFPSFVYMYSCLTLPPWMETWAKRTTYVKQVIPAITTTTTENDSWHHLITQEDSTHDNNNHRQEEEEEEKEEFANLDDDVSITPTLLSVVDPHTQRLVSAIDNALYEVLLHPDTVFETSCDDTTGGSNEDPSHTIPKVTLSVSSHRISFHEELTVSWMYDEEHYTTSEEQDDNVVLVMYCPAEELNPRHFRDAATQGQVLASNAFHNPQSDVLENRGSTMSSSGGSRVEWKIPAFPIVREESCEFRLFWKKTRRKHELFHEQNHGDSMDSRILTKANGRRRPEKGRQRKEMQHATFCLLAQSGPIYLEKSLVKPTGIHLALTENLDEMRVHFSTGGHLAKLLHDEETKNQETFGNVRLNKDTFWLPQVWKEHITMEVKKQNPEDKMDSQIIPVVRYHTTNEHTQQQSKQNENKSYTVVQGNTTSYEASDMCMAPANKTGPGHFVHPGLLHQVTLTQLAPWTEYTYEVGVVLMPPVVGSAREGHIWTKFRGEIKKESFLRQPLTGKDETKQTNNHVSLDPVYVWSGVEYTFRSLPPAGSNVAPFKFLVYGDQGCSVKGWSFSENKILQRLRQEVDHEGQSNNLGRLPPPPTLGPIHHFGDLSYAMGVGHIWNFWLHMIQPFAAKVPLMVGVGNHEYDHTLGGDQGTDPSGEITPGGFRPSWGNFGNDSRGECGVPTSRHFSAPKNGNGVFWYSFDYASTHVIMLSSEHDLSMNSTQYSWLREDLQAVDRTITPWLIVEMHRPMYNSVYDPSQHRVAEGLRNEFEPLLKEFKVDLVLAGHYHSYLRTCDGLYDGMCDNGGPMHITIGTAGASLTKTKKTYHGQNWTRSVIRKFGYGRITVYNSSALQFEFVRDDSSGTVDDRVWLLK